MIQIIAAITAIAIPILSGLTFLAYKHPHAYKKFALPSAWFKVGFSYLIAYLFWNMGIITAYKKLLPFIPSDKAREALSTLDSLTISTELQWFVIGCWFILWFFFVFLDNLQSFLKKNN